MKVKSFCIPVLGHMADVQGTFSPGLKVHTKQGETILKFSSLSTGNKTLDKLVLDGFAKYVARVSCLKTMYLQIHDLVVENGESQISLKSHLLREKINIHVFICSTKKITSFMPDGMAAYFQGTKFTVEPGEIMAFGVDFSFLADKEFNPLKPRLSSFVRIKCGEDDEGPVMFDLDNDNLEIVLSKKDWDAYPRVKQYPPSLIHSTLVLPLLTEAVRAVMADEPDIEYSQLKWFVRLEQMVAVKGMKNSGEEPYTIAQILLEGCISRAFDELAADIETENAI